MEKKSYLKNLKIKAEGPIGKSKDFIEEEQLLDADLWKDCVNVFTNNCDDADCGWRGEYWERCYAVQPWYILLTKIRSCMNG